MCYTQQLPTVSFFGRNPVNDKKVRSVWRLSVKLWLGLQIVLKIGISVGELGEGTTTTSEFLKANESNFKVGAKQQQPLLGVC